HSRTSSRTRCRPAGRTGPPGWSAGRPTGRAWPLCFFPRLPWSGRRRLLTMPIAVRSANVAGSDRGGATAFAVVALREKLFDRNLDRLGESFLQAGTRHAGGDHADGVA